MPEDLRPAEDDAPEPDLRFESLEGLDPAAPPPPKPSEELFHPSEHTERVDPSLCRVLVVVSLALSVLGVCLPSCLAVPMIVAGGALAAIAYSLRERRLSHIAIGVAVAALLLHGLVIVAKGVFGGLDRGVIQPYEKLLQDE